MFMLYETQGHVLVRQNVENVLTYLLLKTWILLVL